MSGVHRQQIDGVDVQMVSESAEVSSRGDARCGLGHAAQHCDHAALTGGAQQGEGGRDSSGLHRFDVDAVERLGAAVQVGSAM